MMAGHFIRSLSAGHLSLFLIFAAITNLPLGIVAVAPCQPAQSPHPVKPPSSQPPVASPPSVKPPAQPPAYQAPPPSTPTAPPTTIPRPPPSSPPQVAPPLSPPVATSPSPPIAPPVPPPTAPPVSPPIAAPPSSPPAATPPYPPLKRYHVAVEGVVYCRTCKLPGYNKGIDASPLPGAIVKLQCLISGALKLYQLNATTDANGYFYIQASPRVSTLNVSTCKVYLVYSPVPTCAKPSNYNGGVTGSVLRFKKILKNNGSVYALHTAGRTGLLFFAPTRSNSCPKTTT